MKLEFRDWAAGARPRLRRTAFLLCADWHLAEDLAQETLLRMYAVWHRVTRSGNPDGYARKVLVNLYRAALRRPSRREHVTETVPDQATIQVGFHEDREALLSALADLGGSQRAIVVLRYWEDMSVTEVAELLKLSPGTVKSQASRALANLRERLPDQTSDVWTGSES